MQSRYCLHVAETVDPIWAAWLGDYSVERNEDGTTAISGDFATQEALLQLLRKMGELGMTLLAVEQIEERDPTGFQSI